MHNFQVYKDLPTILKDDKEVVMAAVSYEGGALRYASESLKNDKEVVMTAVSNNGSALSAASRSLRNDKEVVMAAVSAVSKGIYKALSSASDSLKNDKEVVMAAVSNTGISLEYASESLKNYKEVVMAAVSNDGNAYQYASESLKEDLEVVLAALETSPYAIPYAEKYFPDKIIYLVAKSTRMYWENYHYDQQQQVELRQLVEKYPEQVSKFDAETGLCPFMVIASRKQEEYIDPHISYRLVDTLFNMMKICPELVRFYDCLETNQHIATKKQKMNDGR